MDNKNIYTWKQALSLIANEQYIDQEKDIASVFTYSRKYGLGKAITFQKTLYNSDDLQKLQKIIAWWKLLNTMSAPEWRNKESTQTIINQVVRSLACGEPLVIYAIFCPSYKTGQGMTGYTGTVGNHTKKYIRLMSEFVSKTEGIGVKVTAIAFLSDLILENYEKLVGTTYKTDLEKNFNSFKQEFGIQSGDMVSVRLLSAIEDIKMVVGEKGVVEGPVPLSGTIYHRVTLRNMAFYKAALGWKNSMVRERTAILAKSYARMGVILKNLFPSGIMFWTESAYERGEMYNSLLEGEIIPIIYPKKNDESIS